MAANVLILGMDMHAFQTGDPLWMTYLQARENGSQVQKGEHSTTIFFAKPYQVEDDKAENGPKTVSVLKHYAVFHASQIEGIPPYKPPGFEVAPWTRPEAADIILKKQQYCYSHRRRPRFLLARDRPNPAPARPRLAGPGGIQRRSLARDSVTGPVTLHGSTAISATALVRPPARWKNCAPS